uniref:Ig-like domain-containing protein n=1 Tax=Poecilia formosa TaxID=48698 RepID=A0A096MAT2_POEFO
SGLIQYYFFVKKVRNLNFTNRKPLSHFIILLFVFPGLITVNVSQSSDAILPCSPTTKEDLSFKSFKWRKDGLNVFHYDAGNHYNNGLRGQDPQFKDRVSFFQDQLRSGNASIQIQNVTIQDSGIYSCEISRLDSGSQTFNIKLVPLQRLLSKDVPTLHATEDSDVMLPCSLSGKDLRQQVFDWKKDGQEVFLYNNGDHYNNGQHENFKNRVEFFQDQLQFGNASIRIKNTKQTDSGNYSC